MQKYKIVLFSMVAAVAYGILHDQITIRLCIEYFTVAHPPLFHTRSPTLLAICWGSVATVWVGLALGILLALVSQSQNLPPIPLPRLYRGIVVLLFTMAVCAALAGVAGYELSRRGIFAFPGPAHWIAPAHHDLFMAVWFAHNTSYLVGFAGGGFWIFRLWLERGKPRVVSFVSCNRWGMVRAAVLFAFFVWILHSRLRGL